MKPSDLKFNYETKNPEGYFFSRKTMRFFGDTMANFGVRDGGHFWILYTKKPTKAGLREYYFDKNTFARLYNVKEA